MTWRIHSGHEIIVDCTPEQSIAPVGLALTFGEQRAHAIQTPAGAWLPIEVAEQLIARLQAAVATARGDQPPSPSLSDLIRQVEARGWLWEGGYSQGPCEEGRRFWVRLWLPTLDPMHEDFADEREGYGATLEEATRLAIEALPPKVRE